MAPGGFCLCSMFPLRQLAGAFRHTCPGRHQVLLDIVVNIRKIVFFLLCIFMYQSDTMYNKCSLTFKEFNKLVCALDVAARIIYYELVAVLMLT